EPTPPTRPNLQCLSYGRALVANRLRQLELRLGHLVGRGLAPGLGVGKRLHSDPRPARDPARPRALYSRGRDLAAAAGELSLRPAKPRVILDPRRWRRGTVRSAGQQKARWRRRPPPYSDPPHRAGSSSPTRGPHSRPAR